MTERVLCVIGTRPEAIKMAPIIQQLRRETHFDTQVLASAQHRDLLDQVLSVFEIYPDGDLDIMRPNQGLSDLTSRLIASLDDAVLSFRPQAVLAQGDTTTVMAIALVCFYNRIPFGHVEAGLRTGDLQYPFPEEMNRIVASRLARWHFAPTISAKTNLLREGIEEKSIFITGNTVIDALLQVAGLVGESDIGLDLDPKKRLILVTAHRRENFGKPFGRICEAIRRIADQHTDVQVLYPVHHNPNITRPAYDLLARHPRIILCPPLEYKSFVAAMKRAYLILSDSGGVQEEGPALGRPVLVLRSETERPEAVEEGVAKLVGTEVVAIENAVHELLCSEDKYKQMARGISPYGDGRAAERIVRILTDSLMQANTALIDPEDGSTTGG